MQGRQRSTGLFMTLRYNTAGASSRVRGYQLAAALRAAGTDVAVLGPDDPHWRRRYYGSALTRRVLYIQKRVSEGDLRLMRARRALGLSTIFDLDDAPGSVSQDPAQEAVVERLMRAASAVTVGGDALREFALRHNGAVEVIPSSVDTTIYTGAPRANDVVTLGWIGNGAGYAGELSDLSRVVARVRERTRVRVVIVGAMDRPDVHTAFSHADDTVVDAVDWSDERAIVAAMRAFDVGVYPLRDNRYNAFKCGYKAIQYMALGLPVVASPVGENGRIVSDGVSGYLPRDEAEWVERLCELCGDAGLRARQGEAGRNAVVERYSLDVAARRLHALLDRLAGL